MTKKELEAKVRELEARIALLEVNQKLPTTIPVLTIPVTVPYSPPQPYWGVPHITWKTAPDVDLTRGAGAVAAEGALNTKTYTFGQ